MDFRPETTTRLVLSGKSYAYTARNYTVQYLVVHA